MRGVIRLKNILDVGCGNQKRPHAIGVDCNPNTSADIIHDLNVFPYPFEDSVFDEIYADNVMEHLDNVIRVMEELHRISQPNGRIKVIVPYFRSQWACIDPTHKHYFTADSFNYFDPSHMMHTRYNYSAVKYKVESVVFNESLSRGLFMSSIKYLANKNPQRYEHYLGHFFPLDSLTFYLRTIK